MQALTRLSLSILIFIASLAHAAPLRLAVLADAGYWNDNAALLQQSVKRSGVNKLVLPGDNLYWGAGSYEDHWGKKWAGFEFPIVAIGNHTVGYAEEVSYFKMPGEYYTKTLGNQVRFLVLNSDNVANVGQQLQWLELELQKTPEVPFTFLVWHHPPYTITDRHNWKEKQSFQETIRPLLQRYRKQITGVLLGHDHIAGVYTAQDLPLFVSGAAFENFSAPKVDLKAEDGVAVKSEWAYDNDGPTWLLLSFDEKPGSARASFVRARDDKILYSVFFQSNLGL